MKTSTMTWCTVLAWSLTIALVMLCSCDVSINPVDDVPVAHAERVDLMPASPPDAGGMTVTCTVTQQKCTATITGQEVPVVRCIDVSSDPRNCGACGVRCSPNLPDCCNGVCVNVQNFADHCGTCSTACPAGMWCGAGTCAR